MIETQTPEILELLSEIEAREEASTGAPKPEGAEAIEMGDPRGCTVLNTTGHDVGVVEDLYVDPNTREPHYALLNLGRHMMGIGNRHVLANFDDLEPAGDKQVRVRAAVA